MSTFQERLKAEAEELNEKIDKLEKFLDGPIADTLEKTDKSLLEIQHSLMTSYYNVLLTRIERLTTIHDL